MEESGEQCGGRPTHEVVSEGSAWRKAVSRADWGLSQRTELASSIIVGATPTPLRAWAVPNPGRWKPRHGVPGGVRALEGATGRVEPLECNGGPFLPSCGLGPLDTCRSVGGHWKALERKEPQALEAHWGEVRGFLGCVRGYHVAGELARWARLGGSGLRSMNSPVMGPWDHGTKGPRACRIGERKANLLYPCNLA